MKKNNNTQKQEKTISPKKETETGAEEFEEQVSKEIRMKPQPLNIPEKGRKAKGKKK